MPDVPFILSSRGSILEITLSKGKANVISAEDSRELNRMWEAFPGQSGTAFRYSYRKR